jgi:hypothetical protein
MLLRWVMAFRAGPYIRTSGWEEESLFAIWKRIHGQKVYANPFAPPFAESYFNWLFYWAYGTATAAINHLLQLSPSALPGVARSLTVLLTVLSAALVYALLAPLNALRRVAGSAIIALNPLVGFWSVTARPDIAALACDLAGLWCVKKACRAGSAWLIPACMAFYGAWAFKQIYVAALLATLLYLFAAGKRAPAIFLGASVGVGFCATLALGTADYRYALLWSQVRLPFSVAEGFHSLLWAFLKAPLFGLGLISVLVMIRNVHRDLLALTALVSCALMLPASGKLAAADNYFIEPAALCSVVLLAADTKWPVIAGAAAQLLPVAMIFAGAAGQRAAMPIPELALLQTQLAELPGPIVVTVNQGNLPWFQEKPPNFVLAATYAFEHARGAPFAFDGVGGMIRSGRIRVLVCPRSNAAESFDGVVPASLRKIGEDSYWDYFETTGSGASGP